MSLIKLAKSRARSIGNLVSTFSHAIQVLFTVNINFALRIQWLQISTLWQNKSQKKPIQKEDKMNNPLYYHPHFLPTNCLILQGNRDTHHRTIDVWDDSAVTR